MLVPSNGRCIEYTDTLKTECRAEAAGDYTRKNYGEATSINSGMTRNVEISQPIHEGKVIEDIRCHIRQVVWIVNEQVLIKALDTVTEKLRSFTLEIDRNRMRPFILRTRVHLGSFEMLEGLTWFNS